MTENEFRIIHSRLIGCYQEIEWRMKCLCAALCFGEGKNWFQKMDDFDSDPLGKMIQLLQAVQQQKQLELLTPEEILSLNDLRETRNWWVHQCFTNTEKCVTFSKGKLRKSMYEDMLKRDFDDALRWEERITEIELAAVDKYIRPDIMKTI